MANKQDKPLISIITPVYNGASFLDDYRKMLCKQDEKSFEVIAVDDGSSDDSYCRLLDIQKLMENQGIHFLAFKQQHSGQASAVNKALKHVNGKYLTWIDVDDYWEKGFLSKMSKALNNNRDSIMAYCFGEIEQKDGTCVPDNHYFNKDELFEMLFYERIQVFAGRFMIRFDEFSKIYPEREIDDSPIGQNLQLLLPPASFGTCVIVEECLHCYRYALDSSSKQEYSFTKKREMLLELQKLYFKILGHCKCSKDYYKEVDNIISNCMKNLLMETSIEARKQMKNNK